MRAERGNRENIHFSIQPQSGGSGKRDINLEKCRRKQIELQFSYLFALDPIACLKLFSTTPALPLLLLGHLHIKRERRRSSSSSSSSAKRFADIRIKTLDVYSIRFPCLLFSLQCATSLWTLVNYKIAAALPLARSSRRCCKDPLFVNIICGRWRANGWRCRSTVSSAQDDSQERGE